MTEDHMQSLKDDIAYMKALAQEGRNAPLLGGSILIAAGLIFGLASLAQWAVLAHVLSLGRLASNSIWLGAFALFMVVLFTLIGRMKARPRAGASSAANRASRAVWTSIGFAIFSMGLALAAMQMRFPGSDSVYLFPSLILALYGAGWAVSGVMAGQRWMSLVAFAAWVAAPALALLAGTATEYLAYAGALVVCTVLPGLKMVREEPSDIV